MFERCPGFERLRGDAAAQERTYADRLAARALPREAMECLPPAQRAVASAIAGAGSTADVQAIDDPFDSAK